MNLFEFMADLEDHDDLHEARLLLLLSAFSGPKLEGSIEGLTKLAKLDFLLRYPVMLEKALVVRGRSATSVNLEPHERNSVESQMVRYRFGPWDHRYRRFLNLMTARGLVKVTTSGKRIDITLTTNGWNIAEQLATKEEFKDMAYRAALLKSSLDLTATNLMRFIYETFPELVSLRMNRAIEA